MVGNLQLLFKIIFGEKKAKSIQAWTNLFLRSQFFGPTILLAHLIVHGRNRQNQSVRMIKKLLETLLFVLYYLNENWTFHAPV